MLDQRFRLNKRMRHSIVTVSVVFSIILVLISFFVFTSLNGKQIIAVNQQYLIHDAKRSAKIIVNSIADGQRNISVLSELVEKTLQSPTVDIESFQHLSTGSMFDYVAFVDPDGVNHSTDGNVFDASDRQYYQKAMQGSNGVELIYESQEAHENLLMFYSPVRYEGTIIGSLVGVYQASQRLSEMLLLDYFDETADAYLCDGDGCVIACSHVLDAQHKQQIADVLAHNPQASDAMDNARQHRISKSFVMNDHQTAGFILYMPELDWYLVQIFPSAANVQMIRQQNNIGLALAVMMCAIFLFLLFVIVREHTKQEKAIKEALTEANNAEEERNQQLRVLKSIADIYYSMHIIDLDNYHFTEYSSRNEVRKVISADYSYDAAVVLPKVMQATMSDEALEEALEFSRIDTLAERMTGKKIIFKDLLGKNVGWIRLSFITIQADEQGVPKEVIVTTQIVDAEKRRESQLILASSTDKLTGCLNRKAYEDDLATYPPIPPEKDFVFIVHDINGLKEINDTKGHEAGDELILGASECMKRCIGNYGRIYRTGGDEFAAIIFADEPTLKSIMSDFEEAQSEWRGKFSDDLSISTGFATKREFPTWTTRDIAAVADRRMYENKEHYYQEQGHERRIRKTAQMSLISLYSKILKVNLTDDTYQIISMDSNEQKMSMGFSPRFSEWLHGFGLSGQVHPEDLDAYLRQTDLNDIREYFRTDKQSMALVYRRRYGDVFKQVAMEMIPADDYTHDKQSVFLFVKKIDK